MKVLQGAGGGVVATQESIDDAIERLDMEYKKSVGKANRYDSLGDEEKVDKVSEVENFENSEKSDEK